MKITSFCFALAVLFLELPGVAQTNLTPGTPDSQHNLSPAEIRKILSGVRVGGGPFALTPPQKALEDAKMDKINDLDQAGTEALHNKNFVVAEAAYRGLIQATSTPQMAPQTQLGPAPYYGLGEALAGQGKTAEAIAAYKVGVYYPLNFSPEAVAASQAKDNKPNLRGCCLPVDSVAWMKYALLLSQTGQNAEAFSVYTQALRYVHDMNRSQVVLFPGDGSSSPAEFQAAVHVALGLLVSDTGNDHEQAMMEFDQALRLAPNTAVTNYYYAYGWRWLDRNSPTRTANVRQAKAALAKAAASEDDTIKKAAEEAMKRMP
jgi:tetratricopeptide (TPR) repeat protein